MESDVDKGKLRQWVVDQVKEEVEMDSNSMWQEYVVLQGVEMKSDYEVGSGMEGRAWEGDVGGVRVRRRAGSGVVR